MPQTSAQIAHMREIGVAVVEMDTLLLTEPDTRRQEMDRLTVYTVVKLLQGEHVVLHSSNHPEAVEQTKAKGRELGMTPTEISRLVSRSLAEITVQVTERTGQSRLIIAGGETSAAVCERMGITGLRVWREIAPGLPSCVSLTDPARLLVLKSGSFGSPDFFQTAIEHVRSQ
jgi:uncharacterized protein YgbK (DUF1537 family)